MNGPDGSEIDSEIIFQEFDLQDASLEALKGLEEINDQLVLVIKSANSHAVAEIRRVIIELINLGIDCPVVVKRTYANLDEEKFQLDASVDLGALLLDGLIDGIWIDGQNVGGQQVVTSTAFGILSGESQSNLQNRIYFLSLLW